MRIEIWNTGPGLCGRELARVQEPEEQGDGSMGTGLGLALAASLALKNGLGFDAKSVPGCGSVFSATGPLA